MKNTFLLAFLISAGIISSCKKDVSVVRAVLGLLLVIGQADAQQRKIHKILNQHATAIIQGVQKVLIVPSDAEGLNSRIVKMLEIDPPYFDLKLLESK